MYHYFYKITNNINNHFYYGVHSTDKLDDGYMGSGKRLQYAYKKYGIENFTKEIIKFFDTKEDAFLYEAEIVTEELVKDDKCYNLMLGGKGFNSTGLVPVEDKFGNRFFSPVDDPKIKTGELQHLHKNMLPVKDSNGNFYSVSSSDHRYTSGELIPIWKGRTHRNESKEKMHQTHLKNDHQKGEKNSQYGTCWMTNGKDNIKIDKNDVDEYIRNGWVKGRYIDKSSIHYEYDKIDIDVIIELRNQNMSWDDIARKLGTCRSTLLRYRKRHNIEI